MATVLVTRDAIWELKKYSPTGCLGLVDVQGAVENRKTVTEKKDSRPITEPTASEHLWHDEHSCTSKMNTHQYMWTVHFDYLINILHFLLAFLLPQTSWFIKNLFKLLDLKKNDKLLPLSITDTEGKNQAIDVLYKEVSMT